MQALAKIKLKRVWHPWDSWEEIEHNMWGTVRDRAAALKRAIEFTGDHNTYGRFMLRVVKEWPISCENALTDAGLNQKAWVGHAACALALNCPEDITREAWGHLTDEQRILANEKAARAILCWKINYAKGKGLLRDVGAAMLFEWDTG